MVRGRQAECVLQLRRPASGQAPEQGSVNFCSGAGRRCARLGDLSRTVCAGERICRAAARFLRFEGGRSRDHPHADGSGVAGHHAGLCAAGSDSLGGVWRVQRRGLRHARGRLRQPRADHDGWLLPQWQAARSQSGRRYCARSRQQRRTHGRQGAGVEAAARAECFGFTVREGARLFRG